MKNGLGAISVIAVLLYAACSNKQTSNTQAPAETSKKDLRYKSISNTNGQKLQMAYDTLVNTLSIILDSDTILLHQDTVASGIKYSNSVYVYKEWHGEITLDSSGKTVFSSKPAN